MDLMTAWGGILLWESYWLKGTVSYEMETVTGNSQEGGGQMQEQWGRERWGGSLVGTKGGM